MKSDPENYARLRRPGFGNRGKAIRLWANFFTVQFPDRTVFHYDVDIRPEPLASIKRAIFNSWVTESKVSIPVANYCVFDGQRNLYSPEDLNFGRQGKTFTLSIENSNEKFTVVLKEAARVDMAMLHHYLSNDHPPSLSADAIEYPRDKVQALEVLLRHVPQSKYITYGKGGGSFYSDEFKKQLREGLEVYFGWYQSLRPVLGPIAKGSQGRPGEVLTYKQLLLNIDIAVTAFYQSGPLVDVVTDFFKSGPSRPRTEDVRSKLENQRDFTRLERFLRNVVIDITHRSKGRRRYKICGLSKPANRCMIEMDGGNSISVADYFKQAYNITLQYPWLPCVSCGSKKDILFPMELCKVRPNQRHAGKLNDLQTADMIKVSAVPPAERKGRIEKGIRALHGKDTSGRLDPVSFLKTWGVSVGSDMIPVEARLLPPPKISFNPNSRGGDTVVATGARWRVGQGKNVAVAGQLISWSVAVFCSPSNLRSNEACGFAQGLAEMLEDMGLKVNLPRRMEDILIYQGQRESVTDTLRKAADTAAAFGAPARNGQKAVDMILCIVSGQKQLYADIKRSAETVLGIMTQCALMKHARDDPRRKKAYFGNISLKINAKLGGTNIYINPKEELPPIGVNIVPSMIVGADVTHPPAGSNGKSIAALVGSMDPKYCEYRTSIRLQESRKEIVEEIDEMLKELLIIFRDRHRILPQRILFYRDGVSEGQFGEVVVSEVTKLKRMFATIYPEGKSPKITFLVVNKRHHARFFVQDRNDGDKNGNLLPGTVIDRDIVHPFEFDFFLNSHGGLQGTSRSAHYHVLYDEIGFTPDNIQELTYRLCYLFCRSSSSVSLVPAVYYAHLVAARARCYLYSLGNEDFDDSMSMTSSNAAMVELKPLTNSIQRRMFFV